MVNDERDTAMVALYASGTTLESIGQQFGVTRERVRQIVRKRGAASAEDARRLRSQVKADRLAEDVVVFLDRYRELVESLAAAGVSRSELEARFALVLPEIPSSIVRHAVDSTGMLFDKASQDVTFSEQVLENAIWYAMARERGLEPDPSAAIADMDLGEARELAHVLQSRGIEADVIATILGAVHAARRHARSVDSTGISSKRYTEQRDRILIELGMDKGTVTVPWPPTSMTLSKRLGNNSWADAQLGLGLIPDSRGRPRGLLDFTEADYRNAIQDFLIFARAVGSGRTFEAYCQWVDNEERSGRRRPSGASVRLRFRSWNTAKRLVAGADGGGAGDTGMATWGPVRALAALHDAQAAIGQLHIIRESASASDVLALVETAVKSIVQEFEFRRRHWLRAAILADRYVTARRLDASGINRKERVALQGGPSAVADFLSDMYLDKLGGGDPTDTGGWLRPDAQAELAAVPKETTRRFRVLKEHRNLLTHGSGEARDRLAIALGELGELDPRFSFRQPITSRTLGRWLVGGRAERLDALVESVPSLWRAMIVAESVLTERPDGADPPSATDPPDNEDDVESARLPVDP